MKIWLNKNFYNKIKLLIFIINFLSNGCPNVNIKLTPKKLGKLVKIYKI